MSTVADLLPPKVRDWAYAILAAVNGGYVVWEAAAEPHLGFLVALGVVNAAGFTLAKANTPKV